MEKILKIESVDSITLKTDDRWASSMEGVLITTTKQVIKVLIGNESCCCEHWGYLMSEDDPDYFLGADLLAVFVADTNLTTTDFQCGYGEELAKGKTEKVSLDCGDVMFVNIETSLGTLQIAVYNAHNGYYGHRVIIESEQLTTQEYL
jgi:hypothetical protein